jgi:zeaxanthin glucosyltransferase
MSIIALLIYPATSHLNSTFKIAKCLKNRGHQIVYFDITDGYVKKFVERQGFSAEQVGLINYPENDHEVSKRNVFSKIKRHFSELSMIDKWILEETIYDEVIASTKPDLILLDFHFAPDVVILSKFKVPIIFYNLFVPLTKAPHVPVCTTSIIPKKSIYSWIQVEFSWVFHKIIKYVENNFVHKFFSSRFEERLRGISIQKLLSAKYNFPYREVIDTDRAFHHGYKNIPEIVSSPKEIDFERRKYPNQINMGSVVDLERAEIMPDDLGKYETCINTPKGQSLIYVSLGTLSNTQFGDTRMFFDKIIKAFGGQNKYRLLLSVGENVDINSFGICPEDVFIFQRVPQIDALRFADVMITHGGISSITECILSEVPMMVFPLSSKFDQPGNAARVVFHKIGLRGKIRGDSGTTIKKKIDTLLNDTTFKNNIKKMREAILESKDFDEGIAFIENLISTKQKMSQSLLGEILV